MRHLPTPTKATSRATPHTGTGLRERAGRRHHQHSGHVGAVVRVVRADRRLAWGLALLAAVGYGLLAGWWTPRGPLSTFEGLTAMALGLAGRAASPGSCSATRWAMLVAPLTFARDLRTGPARDRGADGRRHPPGQHVRHHCLRGRPRRPRAAGPAAHGAGRLRWARRWRGAGCRPGARSDGFLSGLGLWSRRTVAVTVGLALVALAAFVARPATTDPIVDADGQHGRRQHRRADPGRDRRA